jgi:polyisoprenyl-teichoic acid--peptidoglycan teichoic acid transferase
VILGRVPSRPSSLHLGAITASGATAAAGRVRLRRALVLMGMTLVAPGSAQLAAGDKRVGRFALAAFASALGLVVLVVLVGLWRPTELISVFTNLWMLRLLRFALIAYALAWAYLIVDAWRIADPLGLARKQRLMLTGLNGVACFAVTGALLFASHLVAVQRDFIATVFGDGVTSQAEHGRYNILLLGGDAGPRRVGLRPDSITVASVDEQTGRTVLLGLPRNLEDVPFPTGSVMDRHFPHGFDCSGCYLNGVNTWATEHRSLFPHSKDPGVTATTEAVEAITGLHINYYVLIDLKGFQDLVDAVGGVTLKLADRVPIGSVGRITGWIPAGRRHLDGFQALWYARSRATTDDYSRMARQKCLMNAMLHQLNPSKVIANFGDIAKAGKQVISTSIPASQLSTFAGLALKTRKLPVTSVSFVPPKIDTGNPNWALIRSMTKTAIAKAEARDSGGAHRPHATKKRHNANDTADLAGSC